MPSALLRGQAALLANNVTPTLAPAPAPPRADQDDLLGRATA